MCSRKNKFVKLFKMPKTPSRSPDRHTFRREQYLKNKAEEGEEPSADYLDMFDNIIRQDYSKWDDPKSRELNMEWDLVTTDWILAKARASEAYAQNLYAALCNNDFQRNDVWPRLADQTWGCSWRSAGGIIADMRQEGDYIDWYCSGINNREFEPEDSTVLTPAQLEWRATADQFVSEGTVTDEIREDLFRLGWLVVDS
jgi:hypothetical protein